LIIAEKKITGQNKRTVKDNINEKLVNKTLPAYFFMKKIIAYSILLFAVQLSVTGLYAQKMEGDPVARANKITDWMKTNLKLEDSQVPLVQNINLECARQIQGLQSNPQATRQQKMIAIQANEQNRDDALRKVLTQDQFATWQTKKRKFKYKWREKIREKYTDPG
jgi:hypothetical protein